MAEGNAPWREKKNLKEQWQKGKNDGTRRERPQPREEKKEIKKEKERKMAKGKEVQQKERKPCPKKGK